MVAKKAVVISCLSVFICGAGLVYWAVFGSNFLSSASGKVEDLDKLVARVAGAVKSGHVAAGLEKQECQASTPLHIDALVLGILDGQPALVCARSLEPAATLARPLAIVDLDSKRFDSITRDLPPALISPSLSTASTIVFTHCSKSKIGRYGYIIPHAAYRRDCSLLFVGQNGASETQILGIMSFSALPPGKIDARFTFGDVVADRPDSQMQDYIAYRSADAAKVQSR
jgi:hypothetical protein